MSPVRRVLGGLCVVACLCTAAPARAYPATTTDVEVRTLVLAVYSTTRAKLSGSIPSDFVLRPCFGGSSTADVILLATEEVHANLKGVPHTPIRTLSIMTCAEPPDDLYRFDATEPPFYLLDSYTSSKFLRRHLTKYGAAPKAASISITKDGTRTAFAAVAAGVTIADGSVVSTHTAVDPLFSCAPAPTSGRVIGRTKTGLLGIDFDKVESACLGSSLVRWDAASPMARYVANSAVAPISVDTAVQSARYTFVTLR